MSGVRVSIELPARAETIEDAIQWVREHRAEDELVTVVSLEVDEHDEPTGTLAITAETIARE